MGHGATGSAKSFAKVFSRNTAAGRTSAFPHEHTVWIERIAGRLSAPLWSIVVGFGLGSYLVLILSRLLLPPPAMPSLVQATDFALLLLVFVSLAIPIYVRRTMSSLELHALSMVEDPAAAGDKLAGLSRLAPVGILSAVIFIGFAVPYAAIAPSEPDNPAALPSEFLVIAAFLLLIFFASTALWTLGYSLVGIYRLGKLPLRLKDFALDRILGLKPFASACLRLTALYYLLIALVITPDLVSGGTPDLILLQDVGFLILGLPLFLLPLVSLRARLVRTRSEKMAWINDRFHRAMRKIDAHGDDELPAGLQNELLIIDKIQKEVQSIKSWPFDIGVVAKLITILLSVTAILLSAILRNLLRI